MEVSVDKVVQLGEALKAVNLALKLNPKHKGKGPGGGQFAPGSGGGGGPTGSGKPFLAGHPGKPIPSAPSKPRGFTESRDLEGERYHARAGSMGKPTTGVPVQKPDTLESRAALTEQARQTAVIPPPNWLPVEDHVVWNLAVREGAGEAPPSFLHPNKYNVWNTARAALRGHQGGQ